MNTIEKVFHYTLRGTLSNEDFFLAAYLACSFLEIKEDLVFKVTNRNGLNSSLYNFNMYIEGFEKILVSGKFSSTKNGIYSSLIKKEDILLPEELRDALDHWRSFFENASHFNKICAKFYIGEKSIVKSSINDLSKSKDKIILEMKNPDNLSYSKSSIFLNQILVDKTCIEQDLTSLSNERYATKSNKAKILKDKVFNLNFHDYINVMEKFKDNEVLLMFFQIN